MIRLCSLANKDRRRWGVDRRLRQSVISFFRGSSFQTNNSDSAPALRGACAVNEDIMVDPVSSNPSAKRKLADCKV